MVKNLKRNIFKKSLIGSIVVMFWAVSCKTSDTVPELNIDFPAAFVVNGESNTISVIDLRNNEVAETINLAINANKNQVTTINNFWSHHIQLSPDGKKVAVAAPEFDFTLGHDAAHQAGNSNKAGGIIVVDVKTGKILNRINVPQINYNAAFTKDGKEIWTTTSTHSGELKIYDTENGALIKNFSLGADPTELSFAKDGQFAFVALGESSTVLSISTQKKEISNYIKVDLFPTNVWTGADGMIYVENKNRPSVNIIDPSIMFTTEFIDTDFKPSNAAFNKTQNELWICQASDNKVAYFERIKNEWRIKGRIIVGDDAHAVMFTKDDKFAYVVNQRGNSVSVIDVERKQKIKDIPVGLKPNGIVMVNQ